MLKLLQRYKANLLTLLYEVIVQNDFGHYEVV